MAPLLGDFGKGPLTPAENYNQQALKFLRNSLNGLISHQGLRIEKLAASAILKTAVYAHDCLLDPRKVEP